MITCADFVHSHHKFVQLMDLFANAKQHVQWGVESRFVQSLGYMVRCLSDH